MSNFYINNLILFGLILVTGIIGGQLAHRTRFFPRITGYIFIGFLLGPHVSGILSEGLLNQTKIFTELATGLVLFQLGLRTDIYHLWQKKKLLVIGICESTLTFILLFAVLYLLPVHPLQAAIAAAIGVSSSPAVTLMIANEYNINGPVTESSLNLTAINNVLAFCFFIILLPFLNMKINPDETYIINALLPPLYRILGSLALAFSVNLVLIRLGRFVGKKDYTQVALIAGTLVLTIGLAKIFNVSILFTMLTLGIFLNAFDRKQELMEIEFSHLGEVLFVLLFVITGTHLHIKLLLEVGLMAIIFVVVRLLAKMIPIFLLSRKHSFSKKQSYALGLTLLPMASMAIGLVNTTMDISADFASSISAMIFSAIAILETVGPIITVYALKMVGEIDANKEISH